MLPFSPVNFRKYTAIFVTCGICDTAAFGKRASRNKFKWLSITSFLIPRSKGQGFVEHRQFHKCIFTYLLSYNSSRCCSEFCQYTYYSFCKNTHYPCLSFFLFSENLCLTLRLICFADDAVLTLCTALHIKQSGLSPLVV